jgi:hypothetical protein
MRAAITALALVFLSSLVVATGVARADGDPASDILLVSPVFMPQDANLPAAQQSQLLALAKEAKAAGVPIRVAIISSKIDLGSVPELFGKPAAYARFLGAEIGFVYKQRLLVVMPNGLGVYHGKQSVAGDQNAVEGIKVGPGGAGLATAALTATQRIAAAAGHKLTVPSGSASGSGQSSGGGKGSSSTVWIVLGIGLALIAIALAVSIRMRPLWSRKAASGRSSSQGRE